MCAQFGLEAAGAGGRTFLVKQAPGGGIDVVRLWPHARRSVCDAVACAQGGHTLTEVELHQGDKFLGRIALAPPKTVIAEPHKSVAT